MNPKTTTQSEQFSTSLDISDLGEVEGLSWELGQDEAAAIMGGANVDWSVFGGSVLAAALAMGSSEWPYIKSGRLSLSEFFHCGGFCLR